MSQKFFETFCLNNIIRKGEELVICECKKEGKYLYTAYELIIESEILLPELLPYKENKCAKSDVTIRFGEVSEDIRQAVNDGKTFNFEKNKMWFFIEKVAVFYIYNGDTIIVDPCENYNKDYLRLFINGSSFGMLFIQRNNIAVHGSTLVIEGKSAIFTGLSGAGKSTLSVALRNKGYKFLTDDISLIAADSDGFFAVKPGFPQQKLCKDAMLEMGYNLDDFIKVNDDRDKYAVPVGDLFCEESMPLAAIFELEVGDVDNVEIVKATASEKFIRMMNNIYLIEVTNHSGLHNVYFRKCMEIASKISFYRIIRPREGYTVERQIELIIEKLRQ